MDGKSQGSCFNPNSSAAMPRFHGEDSVVEGLESVRNGCIGSFEDAVVVDDEGLKRTSCVSKPSV